ncbi:MAG: hypothetical protein ACRDT9_03175, partial [Agromyces sp.]
DCDGPSAATRAVDRGGGAAAADEAAESGATSMSTTSMSATISLGGDEGLAARPLQVGLGAFMVR